MALSTDPLLAWLLDRTTRDRPAEALLDDLAARLASHGVPLFRLKISLPTKHPEVFVRNLQWAPGTGTVVRTRARDLLGEAEYLDSPVAVIHRGADKIRCRLTGEGADLSYPVCRDLAAEGATDYLALALDLSHGVRTFVSFATQRAGGFTDAEIALLEDLVPALSLLLGPEVAHFTVSSLLSVYLGPNAAARVLAGAFERGRGELLQAAIWYCDMRGFTSLADRTPPGVVVKVLDRFFEALGEPIASRGGEILKFIGDAALAIFPLGDDPGGACRRALEAGEVAHAAVKQLAGATGEAIEIGIALHVGEVMYGNIGARERLDFTVIGAAVNEVCRVESLCKTLGEPILMTAAFAGTAGEARVKSLGRHALRGVSEQAELFGLS